MVGEIIGLTTRGRGTLAAVGSLTVGVTTMGVTAPSIRAGLMAVGGVINLGPVTKGVGNGVLAIVDGVLRTVIGAVGETRPVPTEAAAGVCPMTKPLGEGGRTIDDLPDLDIRAKDQIPRLIFSG